MFIVNNLLKNLVLFFISIIILLKVFSIKKTINDIENKIKKDTVYVRTPEYSYVSFEYIEYEGIKQGLPDSVANLLARIAVQESGYALNSNVAKKYNNYFGAHLNKICNDNPNKLCFAKYDNCKEAIKAWVKFYDSDPICGNETLKEWLIRRRYNLTPGYYEKLKKVYVKPLN